jgi:hypothetical protein
MINIANSFLDYLSRNLFQGNEELRHRGNQGLVHSSTDVPSFVEKYPKITFHF